MADSLRDALPFAKVVETPEGPALLVGYRVLRVIGIKDASELDAICGALRRGDTEAEAFPGAGGSQGAALGCVVTGATL